MDNEYYIPIASVTGRIFARDKVNNTLSTAAWAGNASGAGDGSRYTSSINAAAQGLLKDFGKTYVSGGRTFRKVQLVVPQSTGTVSTFGVNGKTGTTPGEDYLTGYVEVGFDSQYGTVPQLPPAIAKWGR
jgi:hypothetical protein